MTTVSRAVALFGTEEPVEPPRILRAGPLTVELDSGQLRNIRYRNREVLRAIAYLVRDVNWGTAGAAFDGLEVGEDAGGFQARYMARCRLGEQEYVYEARVTGTGDGELRFEASGRAITDVDTCRTGFVVLHPLEGVVDRPVRVTHVDGTVEESRFPRLVSPGQPIFDIRALSHEAVPGVWATCTMEADVAFEMEDHRNWSDASYKTYVRPLRLPKPYRIAAGEVVEQAVSLRFQGEPQHEASAVEDRVAVTVGDRAGGRMPRIGLGVPADLAQASLAVADLIAGVAPQLLVCELDPRKGHGVRELSHYRELAEATRAEVVLELTLPCERELSRELAEVAKAVRESRIRLAAVTVCPAVYLKSYQPDGPWPDCPPLEEVYGPTRHAFPGVAIGGGMLTYFTELNRKRPPVEHLDYVTHTTSALVHDADDRSVMQTLEALPWVLETTRSFAGDRPYRVGPSAIGMRHNPYGADVAANPDNRRIAMARNDPRQRGLFAAAWNLGYVAEMARGGIEAVVLSAPVGPFGIVHTAMDWPQPYYDQLEGRAVYPLFHVLDGLAKGGGRPLLRTESTHPYEIAAVAYETAGGPVLWLANLTGEDREIELSGWAARDILVQRLDLASFVAAVTDPHWDWRGGLYQPAVEPVALDAYAVARIEPVG